MLFSNLTTFDLSFSIPKYLVFYSGRFDNGLSMIVYDRCKVSSSH